MKSEIVYNVWVWTSDTRGSGTDANVYLTLYGKKGKTDEIQIGNATDNFEQGQLDKFKVSLEIIFLPYNFSSRCNGVYGTMNAGFDLVLFLQVELANVGSLYKLRVRHDNSKPFADWHLEKVFCYHCIVTMLV